MNDPAVSYCMVPGGGGDDAGLASFEQSHFEDGFNLAQHLAYRRLAEVHLLCGKSCNRVTVACTPASGTLFPLGETTVTCSAFDMRQQTAQCAFVVRVQAALQRTRIVAFGDSITWGENGVPPATPAWRPLVRVDRPYPSLLEEALDRQYPFQADDIAVPNEGVPGEVTANGLKSLPGVLASRQAQVVLLLEGANDLNATDAGRSYYAELLGSGVKIYERRGALLHAKSAVIGGVWATLQRPISISKGMLCLDIGPQAISVGPITAKDSTLTARLDLLAAPKMLSGSRPPDGTLPLPPLGRTSASADTAIMAMDGILLYSVASDVLRKKLAGKYLTRFRQVQVDDVTLLPAGRGRIVIAIRVKGRLYGTFYVVGQPHYDPSTDLITIPDLASTSSRPGRSSASPAG